MSERQGERERGGETGGWETERDRKKQKEKERNTEGSYSLYPLCIEVISIMYTMENDTYLIEWLHEWMFYLGMEHQ